MDTESERLTYRLQSESRHHRRAVLVFGALVVTSAIAVATVAVTGGKADLPTLLSRAESAVLTHPGRALAAYTAICLLTQLIVVPSGTVIALAGGYLLGAGVAGGVLSVAGLIASVVVFATAREALAGGIDVYAAQAPQRQQWLQRIRSEGAMAVVTLRLAPIIPNAVAATLAAGAGLGFGSFIMASLASIWVRPLAYASLGASMREIADAARGVPASLAFAMAGLFLTALLILTIRLTMLRK